MVENMVAFDWDATIENDSQGFVLLPAGIYPFEVTKFERGRHDGSAKLPPCNKAMLTIAIDGGDLGMTYVQHNLFLHQKTEGLLCEFFTAIGMRKHGERLQMNWNYVPGAKGWCKITVDKFEGRDGEEKQNNKITQFIDPENAPKATTSAAPAAAPWASGKF